VGDVVSIVLSGSVVTNMQVSAVDSQTQLTVTQASLTSSSLVYAVYKSTNLTNEAEQVKSQ